MFPFIQIFYLHQSCQVKLDLFHNYNSKLDMLKLINAISVKKSIHYFMNFEILLSS